MAHTSDPLCQSCGEREATILFTRIHVDQKETLRLCAICVAREAEEEQGHHSPGHAAVGGQNAIGGQSTAVPTESAGGRESTPAEGEKVESGQDAEELTADGTTQKVAEINVVIGHLSEERKGPSNECPRCGMTYERFRKHGRFGCSDCYAAFSSELERLFKRIHGSRRHAGKAPPEQGVPRVEQAPGEQAPGEQVPGEQVLYADPSEVAPQPAGAVKTTALSGSAVDELRHELELAVTDEDYERAAELRDRIAQLEGEAGND